MKKSIFITLLSTLLCTVFLFGCSEQISEKSDVNAVESEKVIKEESNEVDLTVMSSTMVYAEVYNILNTPDDYLGKQIKVKGICASEYYEDTDTTYHFVIITDATSCCSQGLEFIWTNHGNEDYPEDGTEIVFQGLYDTYIENGDEYCYIKADNITIQ